MALDKNVVPLPFAGGIDTKTDPLQVSANKLLLLENAKFETAKELRKVPGDAPLSQNIIGSDKIDNAVELASFNNELVLNDGSTLYSYSSDSTAWSDKGTAFLVALEDVYPVVRDNYAQVNQDSTTHPSGLQAFAWEDSSGGVRYSIIDSSSQLQIVSNATVNSGASNPKVISLGNYILIIVFIGTDLNYYAIPIVTPNILPAPVNLASTVDPSAPTYDISIINSTAYVAFNNGSGGISLRSLNQFLSASTVVTVAGDPATVAISVFGDSSNNVWVSYYNGTALKYFIRNSALAPVLNATVLDTLPTIRNVTGAVQGTKGTFFYEVHGSPSYNTYTKSNTGTLTGTVGSPSVLIRSVGLGSKAFIYGANIFFFTAYQSPLQPSYFLVNQAGVVALKLAPSTGGGLTDKSTLPQVNKISDTTYQISYLQQDFFATQNGANFFLTGVQQATLDMNPSAIQSVTIGNGLKSTGGFLSNYDGISSIESGYHLFPENVSITTAPTGGHIPDGTFEYTTVFAWTDNFGQIERSAPSIAQTIVTTGGGLSANTIVAPTLRVTAKRPPVRSNVWIELYRTQADLPIFYLVSSIDFPTYNDTTADTVTFTDILSDDDIIGNIQLYTTGGEIENIAPPAPKLIWIYNSRVILVPAEDDLSWWYAKSVIPGTPLNFTDSFVNNMDSRGGPITAGSQMDTEIVFFKGPSDIFYVTGQGPTPNGLNNDWSQPVRVPVGAGCIDPNSVLLMPNGLFYKSMKGFYLLNRSLQASYVGAEVEAFNGASVTSSQLILNDNELRFTLSNNTMLMFDYSFEQWTTIPNVDAIACATFQNEFCYVQPDGLVLQEDPNIWTHNGNFRRIKLVTAWISLAQLQGFQRVYKSLILGTYKSPHKLKVNVAVNFNPSHVQEDYITASALLANPAYGEDGAYGIGSPYGGTSQVYQWRVFMKQQKCQSIQYTIEEIPLLPYGEGLSLSAITLEVGTKKGAFKVAPNRSVG